MPFDGAFVVAGKRVHESPASIVAGQFEQDPDGQLAKSASLELRQHQPADGRIARRCAEPSEARRVGCPAATRELACRFPGRYGGGTRLG